MRLSKPMSAAGLAALATPALAHPGDHGGETALHFLGQHGIAAGLVLLALVAGGVVLMKRKG